MKKIEHKGLTIRIEQDEDPESPREWDNLATMLCFHKRYSLGDKTDLRSDAFNGWGEVEKHLRKELGAVLVAALYLYDHSGLRMKIGSFIGHAQHAEWDSGQVGFIYVTREALLKEHSAKRITKKMLAQAQKNMEGEVETYDQYLSGQVYGYIVEDEDGEHLDSCWGFYGYEYCLEEAKSVADHHAEKAEQVVLSENNNGNGI